MQLTDCGWAEDSRIFYTSLPLGRDYAVLRAAVLRVISSEWPIRAVLHLAGVLQRASLATLSDQALASETGSAILVVQFSNGLGNFASIV